MEDEKGLERIRMNNAAYFDEALCPEAVGRLLLATAFSPREDREAARGIQS
jgi:hypothetical protein